MKPILIDLELVEPGSVPQLVTSRDTERVVDLPAAITPDGHVVSRWRLTDEERSQVLRGGDIYLFMLTGGAPVQPVSLVVGPEQRPFEQTAGGEHLAANGNPIDGWPSQMA